MVAGLAAARVAPRPPGPARAPRASSPASSRRIGVGRVGRAAAALRAARHGRRAGAGRGPGRPALGDPDHVDLGEQPRLVPARLPRRRPPRRRAPGSTDGDPTGSSGPRLDGRRHRARPPSTRSGPRLLLFPLEVLRKSDQFRGIEEWQPLRLDGVWPLLFVGQVLLAAAPPRPAPLVAGRACRSSCSPAWRSCRPATSPSPASSSCPGMAAVRGRPRRGRRAAPLAGRARRSWRCAWSPAACSACPR